MLLERWRATSQLRSSGGPKRRPEIVADYEREILGTAPAHLPKVTWEVVKTTPQNYDGIDVITKRLTGHVDNSIDPQISVNIHMVVMHPGQRPAPVPVIMELAFDTDFQDALSQPVSEVVPAGSEATTAWHALPLLQARLGFRRALAHQLSGRRRLRPDRGHHRPDEQRPAAQPRRLGHVCARGPGAPAARWTISRPTTLSMRGRSASKAIRASERPRSSPWLTIRDLRFSTSSSGEGGAKLYRHIFGEQMPNVTGPPLYHWFSGNFLRYGGPLTPGDLPVDNHELIALSAPRPVFIGGGADTGDGYADPSGDAWADTRGMFLAEVAAGPVYRLLGKNDLGTTEFPPIETALISGDLGFRQHPYGHTPAPNWPAFLEFAGKYFPASNTPASRD